MGKDSGKFKTKKSYGFGLRLAGYICIIVISIGMICLTVLFSFALLEKSKLPKNRYPDYDDLHKFQPDREGGHLLPSIDTLSQGERDGQGVQWVTNSKGFRNEVEFNDEYPSWMRRLLFFGDSYVDGMRTDQKDTIGYLLSQGLDRRAGRKIHQVMISGANNPVNAWYNFQQHSYKYNPQVVLLGVTLGNDLTWHSYGAAFIPEVDKDGRQYLKKGVRDSQAGIFQKALLPEKAFAAGSVLDSFWDLEFKTRNYISSKSFLFSQLSPPLTGPWKNRRRKVYAGGFFTSLGLFYKPLMPEFEVMYKDFEATILGFSREVEKHEALFVVVLFPVRIQVDNGDWGKLVRGYSLNESSFDLKYPNRRILAFCERENILCFDLLPEMRKRTDIGDGPFYRGRGDMHFNEAGQELASQMLVDIISKRLSERFSK